MLPELFEVRRADHTENKGLNYRERKIWTFCPIKKGLHFLNFHFKINIFLAQTVQCDENQCVLYYTRNRTLLLGTSLFKPYCSEVHLLNQHYLHIGPAVIGIQVYSSPWTQHRGFFYVLGNSLERQDLVYCVG